MHKLNVSNTKGPLNLVLETIKLIKKGRMPQSEIKIKSIRKRPPIKIKRRNTTPSVFQRTIIVIFRALGILRRAH